MILCDLRESLVLRMEIAASDSEGATDDEVVARIERVTGRAFVFNGASGVAMSVMS